MSEELAQWQFKGIASISGNSRSNLPTLRSPAHVKLADIKKAVVTMTRSVSGNRAHWQTPKLCQLLMSCRDDKAMYKSRPPSSCLDTTLNNESAISIPPESINLLSLSNLLRETLPRLESSRMEVNKGRARWLGGQKHLPCKVDDPSVIVRTDRKLNVLATCVIPVLLRQDREQRQSCTLTS